MCGFIGRLNFGVPARPLESGLAFLQNKRDAEGLKDLQAVVDSFASSSVADNALLQIAQYQLEVAKDLDEAAALAAKQRAEEALKDRTGAIEVAEAQAELLRAMAQLRAIEKLRKLKKG